MQTTAFAIVPTMRITVITAGVRQWNFKTGGYQMLPEDDGRLCIYTLEMVGTYGPANLDQQAIGLWVHLKKEISQSAEKEEDCDNHASDRLMTNGPGTKDEN